MVSLRQRNNNSKGLYFAFLVWFGFFSSSHKELTIVLSKGGKISWTTTLGNSTCQLSGLQENILCCRSYIFFIIGNADIRVQDQRHRRLNMDDKITSNRLTQ